jgi:hypothetical protein
MIGPIEARSFVLREDPAKNESGKTGGKRRLQ